MELEDDRWRRNVVARTRFLVEVGGEPAGTVSGGDSDTHSTMAITAMWVDPRFRRTGVGRRLIDHVLAWGRGQGYGDAVLWVTEVNAAAQKLYEASGFRRTGAVAAVRADEDAIEYEMSRKL